MIRNALLVLGAIIVIGVGFWGGFAMWRHQDEARAFAMGIPYTTFNWNTVYAQNRGCNACHADHLAADVNNLVVGRAKPERHGIFVTSYGIPMRVEDCRICHRDDQYSGSLHSRHLVSTGFTNMGGNCDSCHVLFKGKFLLYDDQTRYGIINGVTRIPTPAFTKPSSDATTLHRQQTTAAQ